MTTALSMQEQEFIQLVRELPPAAVRELEEFARFLAARHCEWSYSDRASLERAVGHMAADPFVRREIEAINAEFSVADADGLENDSWP